MKARLHTLPVAFVVSEGRSGSTLLQNMLDAHPHICAPIEVRFVTYLYPRYGKLKNWNPEVLQSFADDVYAHRSVKLTWEFRKNELLEVLGQYQIDSYSDACKAVYLHMPSMFLKKEVLLIVDKNPMHGRFIETLTKIFPEARFIHLIRDPRAVVASYFTSLNHKNIYTQSQKWIRINTLIERHTTNPLVLHYEKLVSKPEAELKKLFAFIEIPFLPEVLNAHATIKTKYKTQKLLSLPHHHNIGNPVSTQYSTVWKSQFSDAQIRIIEFATEKMMIRYGYARQTTGTPKRTDRIKIQLSRLMVFAEYALIKRMMKLPFGTKNFLSKIVGFVKRTP